MLLEVRYINWLNKMVIEKLSPGSFSAFPCYVDFLPWQLKTYPIVRFVIKPHTKFKLLLH